MPQKMGELVINFRIENPKDFRRARRIISLIKDLKEEYPWNEDLKLINKHLKILVRNSLQFRHNHE